MEICLFECEIEPGCKTLKTSENTVLVFASCEHNYDLHHVYLHLFFFLHGIQIPAMSVSSVNSGSDNLISLQI